MDLSQDKLKVTLFSFGFKHGHPEAEMIWDVRFLPNPYWVDELKEYTGKEKNVSDYVLQNSSGQKFLELLRPLLEFLLKQHKEAKKQQVRLGIGCTGGKHRSVAVVENIHDFLSKNMNIELTTFHRDIEKE